MKKETKQQNSTETQMGYDTVLCAENVVKGAKYELTYIPIEWKCPFCNAENSTTLIEEEDLNYSQDNIDKCRKCKKDVKLRASDIFCT